MDLTDPIAMAFLRWTPDTLAARTWQTLRQTSHSPVTLDALATALEIPEADRPGAMASGQRHAAEARATAARMAIPLEHPGLETYPAALAEIADPPLALWRNGELTDAPHIAIVGSRAATPTGLRVARALADGLARRGYVIVSGMALGVDGAAHEGALAAGGRTVAVLGCGIDVIYPWRHRHLAEAIPAQGALLSEVPPGTAPQAWLFPLRNRIISGLCRAVIVIEATFKSGSLHTARSALDQGRDVLAVPGDVAAGRSEGCHDLIRDGARLVEDVDDVLEELEGIPRVKKQSKKPLPKSRLEAAMASSTGYSLDDLVRQTGRPAPDLLAELGHLELAGRITRMAGGRFRRE